MSATPLSDIQEMIERSLFEVIRLELVDKGYLPDITDLDTYPDTQVGWDQWEADISTIVLNMGFAIELFGVGNSESRGIKKVPRIVLETGNFLPGALGGDPLPFFEDQGDSYSALVTPPQTTDFYINFHLVSNSIAQHRVLNSILGLSVPRRGYIKYYNDPTKSFFARYLNYYNIDDTDGGIIEHIYAYEIPDAWDQEDIIVLENIAKINEITLNPNLQKYMDGSWGNDSDPLIVT